MKMKRHLILPLLFMLTACQSLKPTDASDSSEPLLDNRLTTEATESADLPNQALTPALLYGILAGEMAAQRGESGSAILTYMDLAKQTKDPRLAQRAADFALLKGMVQEAVEALRLWVQLAPDSIIVREKLFIALVRSGQLLQSNALFEALLKQEPNRANFLFTQIAQYAQLQPDKQAAYQMVKSLAQPYPNLSGARFAMLAVASEAGDQIVVAKESARLTQIAPEWTLPVIWQLSRLSHAKAITFLQQELARRPKASLELQLAYPRLLVQEQRLRQAQTEFRRLLTHYPDNLDILYALGLLAYQFKDFSEAECDLQKALALQHSESNLIHYILGQIAEEKQQLDQARHWYERVSGDPYFRSAQRRLAMLDMTDNKTQAAIKRLQQLGDKPEDQQLLALFQPYQARGARQYDAAQRILTEALKTYPNSTDLLYERALVFEINGHIQQAEHDLKRILKLQPKDARTLNALGYTLINHTQRYDEALRYIEQAIVLEPDNPMIWDSLGWAQFKIGQLEAALENLQKAYDKLKDSEVAAHLGEVLWTLGYKDKARAIWSNGRAEKDNQATLTETLRRLKVGL